MRFWQHEKQNGFPRVNAWMIGVCTAAIFLWVVIKPAPSGIFVAVDDLCGVFFPAIAAGFNLWAVLALSRAQTDDTPALASMRRSSLFTLGALFCLVAGQIVSIGYQIVLQGPPPTPSLADVFYLSIYPCALMGILLLPNARRTQLTRTRVVIDSLMIMTAVVTCSWYFILGPTLLSANASPLSRIFGTFYPLGDLVLSFAFLSIIYRANPAPFRFGLRVLICGALIYLATDSTFDYETLHNTFAPGTLIDVGWVAGPMLIAWSSQALFNAGVRMQQDADAPEASPHTHFSLWRAALPYLLMPVVGVLFAFTLYHPTDLPLATGVYVGGSLLIVLLVSRQFLSMRETIAFAREIQALHEKNIRLQALSTTDPLTNLPNHRALQEVLHKELTMATLQGIPLSLVMIDIDHFREFNDQYGHDVGDRVLQHVARTMQDTLDADDFVARYGGEEFVVVKRACDERAIAQTAERIRAAIADSTFIVSSGARVPITVSLGHSTFPVHASVASSLLKAADLALFAAKRSGRNRIAQYSLALLTAQAQEADVPLSLPSEANLETVQALITAIDLRDGYTAAHSEGVSRYAVAIGTRIGLPPQEIEQLRLGGLIHDVGKIGVPDHVLSKAGKLTAEEWEQMQAHTTMGTQVVQDVHSLRHLLPLVRWHHERLDGSGYPDGLRGDEIPYLVRVLSVADVFEAFTAERPYHPARSKQEGLDLLWSEVQKGRMEEIIVRALEDIVEQYWPAETDPPADATRYIAA